MADQNIKWVKTSLNLRGPAGPAGPAGEQGPQGPTGPAGAAFSIAKTYRSIDAMNADYAGTDVTVGQFVLIDTGNVNDADNAKLYVKGAHAYTYLTDLSGAAGMTGPQGIQGIQGPKGPKGDTGATGAGWITSNGVPTATTGTVGTLAILPNGDVYVAQAAA